jgi:hypothetical protein
MKKLLTIVSTATLLVFGLIAFPQAAQALNVPALSVGTVTTTSIQLNWTDADNEDGYRVREVLPGGSLTTLIVVDANVLTYTVTGLGENTTHTYRVVAFVTGGTAKASNDVTATTGTTPTTTTTTTTTTTPPPPVCDVTVTAPASIATAIANNPAGTDFCLSGTFNVTSELLPKADSTFRGPATIQGPDEAPDKDINEADDVGIQLKEQGTNVTLIDLTVRGFEQGVGCWTGTIITRGRYTDNSENGIGCGLERQTPGVTITDAEIDHNGSGEFEGSSAGGAKFARTGSPGVVATNISLHDNIGNGIWCDVQCLDFEVHDSTVLDNTCKGIHYEKSGATDELGPLEQGQAWFEGNTIGRNGLGCTKAARGGITLVSSKHVLVENNHTFGNDKNGLYLRQDGRLDGEKHGWVISDVIVRNNIFEDGTNACSFSGVICSGNS